ncbi:hypothetical protein OJF2_60190 [Aquisphaera giovannonii]|uniref:Uncharacterized protein n=1 Tax=Aquisphaera giovannonii TaxID=406548 RepID=A0A5B9W9W7_9BACT|nr:hypothetical protein [Aquisphaera giovannonii]QEH37428.1 hypothetical protein OJF2_60190 [Aquisphaera giovannonii]
MNKPIAALAVLGTMAACPAWAQTGYPASGPGAQPGAPFVSGGGEAPAQGAADVAQGHVFPNASMLPEPAKEDELKAHAVQLPDEPVEPYLLTKDAGPFMVLAKTFRGPDSQKLALALAKELRAKYNLPAYILRTKDFPGFSNIRGVPPTADPAVVQANVKSPEKYRTFDEAAVLVGNEKTEKDSVALLHRVKKIKPDCLNGMPKFFAWREGLSTAIRTTNPYVPAQHLYQHKHDELVEKMNRGPRSVANCPGRYSLQVAQFSGRSTFNVNDKTFKDEWFRSNLKKSPLATAHDDAETLADKLARDPDVRKLNQPVFVYHDRTSSRVFIGAFSEPRDPVAGDLRDELLKLAVPMLDTKRSNGGMDKMIVPASMLTDLKPIKQGLEN